jgi:hypothetical protein
MSLLDLQGISAPQSKGGGGDNDHHGGGDSCLSILLCL